MTPGEGILNITQVNATTAVVFYTQRSPPTELVLPVGELLLMMGENGVELDTHCGARARACLF